MTATTIRLGGVPEHFNLPIHLAREEGLFAGRGVNLDWTTFKGGTGQMTNALRNDEIDMSILLTEGIITDIIRGNPSKIISEYVTTPLTWGVHTGIDNDLKHYSEIFTQRYAISRFGSGSHLMAIVDANSKGHQLDEKQFRVIKNLKGALGSLGEMESDVFYWEKFTTKPYVDRGQLRRVGEYRTPWPCFVVAATDRILKEEPEAVIRTLRTLHDRCDLFMQSNDKEAIQLVSERYDQKLEDVARWYHSTGWAIHGWVSDKMVKSVLYHLKVAKIIGENQEIPELIWRKAT
ncbi:MAG: sulfonate transport system substrate-binding protein [Polaribacter sp.]|jgi:sulfonate transport system substrate-binding protein